VQDAPQLRKQLEDFQVIIAQSGYLQMSAKAGAHDDLILATGLAYLGISFEAGATFLAQEIHCG
jgi:hypothetical protein